MRRGLILENSMHKRCEWVGVGKPDLEHYHDFDWGVPVHDDKKHFEMLILEGAQAGLSWETILKRRDAYREAFHQFDPVLVASMKDEDLELLITQSSIIRNRLKIFSARKNARVFLNIAQEYGSFDAYVWTFVEGTPKINAPKTLQEIPANSREAKVLSKDLKKRGMTFVGPTIMYAYMQAVGMVNDHVVGCFCKRA